MSNFHKSQNWLNSTLDITPFGGELPTPTTEAIVVVNLFDDGPVAWSVPAQYDPAAITITATTQYRVALERGVSGSGIQKEYAPKRRSSIAPILSFWAKNRILTHMYAPPFHRRILPWIFAVVFFAAAPVVVFYTAGYRWNAKKEKVERNGTLIMNSQPTGAQIILNGQRTGETTPTTLQNIPPGRSVIRYEKAGYYSWQKELDIVPERVTFANTVSLWKVSQPIPILSQPVFRLAASPNGREFAGLVTASGTTNVLVWSSDGSQQTITIPTLPNPTMTVTWADDGRTLMVEDPQGRETPVWMVSLRAGRVPVNLPTGVYRWNGSNIEGVNGKKILDINTSNGQIQQTPLPADEVDHALGFVLRYATDTSADQLVLFKDRLNSRGVILPRGAWSLAKMVSGTIILRDNDRWISINPDEPQPLVHQANGIMMPPYVSRGTTTFLMVNDGELWSWNPEGDPELLLREGKPITGASWHSSGQNIAFGSNGSVAMLNTDPRDGRLRTILTSFNEVSDVAILKKNLYIAAKQNDVAGVWELTIE